MLRTSRPGTFCRLLGFLRPIMALVLLVVGLPILLSTLRHERRRVSSERGRMPEKPETTVSRWFTWKRAVTGGVLAFAALGIFVAAYMLMRSIGIGPVGTLVSTGVLEEQDRIILADFVDRSGDTTLASAVTEAFRVDLGQSPTVTLVQGTDLAEAFARMERDQPNAITVDLAREAESAYSEMRSRIYLAMAKREAGEPHEAALSEADLDRIYPLQPGGETLSTGLFLTHLATHLAYHLGQIDYHRRLVLEDGDSVGAMPIPLSMPRTPGESRTPP